MPVSSRKAEEVDDPHPRVDASGREQDGESNWRVRIIISAAKMPAHAATGTARVVARSRAMAWASAASTTRPAATAATRTAATIAPANRGIRSPTACSANPPE